MWNKIMVGILACLVPMAARAEAGKIFFTSGAVIVRDVRGIERPAARGMALEQGDTVITHDGRTQLRFADGGAVSLIPNTVLQIKEYHYAGKTDGQERSVFGFLKGGLRAITGIIGHKTPSAYRMETSVASIGIRGTEYQAILCESNCKEPDGLYVHVGEGKIFLKNAMGELDLTQGQAGYVPSPESPPQQTTTTPSISSAPDTGTSVLSEIPGINAPEFQAGTITSSNGLGNVLAVTGTVGAGLGASGWFTASDGSSYLHVDANAAGDALPISNAIVGVYMNGSTPSGFIGMDNSGSFASFAMSGAPVNTGSQGGIYWGRWTNTSIDIYLGLGSVLQTGSVSIPSGSSLHYIFNSQTQPTIPGSGIATYSFSGGTPSTDTLGGVGSGITGGNLSANFLTQVVNANFSVGHTGGPYAVVAVMPFKGGSGFATDMPGGSLTVNTVANLGRVAGFFAGTTANAPSAAGLTYKLDTGGGNGIVGVGAFTCSSGC